MPHERRRRQLTSFYGDRGYGRDLEATTDAFPTMEQARVLSELCHGLPPGPILDLGCGRGRLGGPLMRKAQRPVVGADLVLDCCAHAAKQCLVVNADVEALPFLGSTFPLAYSVFTSVGFDQPDIGPTLAEVRRVLVPHGLFFLDYASPRRPGRTWHVERLGRPGIALVRTGHDRTGTTTVRQLAVTGQGLRRFGLVYKSYTRAEVTDAGAAVGLLPVRLDPDQVGPFRISAGTRVTMLFRAV